MRILQQGLRVIGKARLVAAVDRGDEGCMCMNATVSQVDGLREAARVYVWYVQKGRIP